MSAFLERERSGFDRAGCVIWCDERLTLEGEEPVAGAVMAARGDDEVVDDLDAENVARVVEQALEAHVLSGGLRITGGMIVSKGDARRAQHHRRRERFPGQERAMSDAAQGDANGLKLFEPRREEDGPELLALEVGQPRQQVRAEIGGIQKARALWKRREHRAASKLEGDLEALELGGSDARARTMATRLQCAKLREPAGNQSGPNRLTSALIATANEKRDQLRLRQRFRTEPLHSFARSHGASRLQRACQRVRTSLLMIAVPLPAVPNLDLSIVFGTDRSKFGIVNA